MAQSLSTVDVRSPRLATALRTVAIVGGFAVLTAVGAGVRVGGPVPMTLQTLVVIVAGLTAGPWLGSTAQLVYVALGLCGLEWFAAGSATTMGYLAAFAPAAWVAGAIAGQSRRVGRLVLATVVATVLIFVCGVGWLAWSSGDLNTAIALGLIPFLPGAVVKGALAVTIARGLPRLETAPRS